MLSYTPVEDIPRVRGARNGYLLTRSCHFIYFQIHRDLREVFRTGKTRSVAFRKQQLLNLCYLVEDNWEQFKDALQSDLGRPREEAEVYVHLSCSVSCSHMGSSLELNGTLLELKEAYDKVEKWAAPEQAPFSWLWFATSPHVRNEPKGVVLLISPFNYPLYLLLVPFVCSSNCCRPVMFVV